MEPQVGNTAGGVIGRMLSRDMGQPLPPTASSHKFTPTLRNSVINKWLWEVVYDWRMELGLGGILGWLAKTFWSSYQRRVERGRDLLEKARPDLEPLGRSVGAAGAFRVRLKNRGTGVARNLCLKLGHCSHEAIGGEIQPGEEGQTEELYFEDQPIHLERQKDLLNLTVTYIDRFENLYKTAIPVTQTPRNDGKFNLEIHWGRHVPEAPKISPRTRWKAGK